VRFLRGARLVLAVLAITSIAAEPTLPAQTEEMLPTGPLTILFHNDSSAAYSEQSRPLRVGTNRFKVLVKDGSGKRVGHAEVSITFDNLSEQAENDWFVRMPMLLAYRGDGLYSGATLIPSTGEWSATIVVRKNDREIGRRTLTMTTVASRP